MSTNDAWGNTVLISIRVQAGRSHTVTQKSSFLFVIWKNHSRWIFWQFWSHYSCCRLILHFKLICLIWFPPGVRPKLSHPSILAGSVGTLSPSRNMRFDDFLIIEKRAAESQVFHLFGIESPGLTSSLGIAQYISSNIYWSRHDKAWIPHTMCKFSSDWFF